MYSTQQTRNSELAQWNLVNCTINQKHFFPKLYTSEFKFGTCYADFCRHSLHAKFYFVFFFFFIIFSDFTFHPNSRIPLVQTIPSTSLPIIYLGKLTCSLSFFEHSSVFCFSLSSWCLPRVEAYYTSTPTPTFFIHFWVVNNVISYVKFLFCELVRIYWSHLSFLEIGFRPAILI
jgi:hypothetical protein